MFGGFITNHRVNCNLQGSFSVSECRFFTFFVKSWENLYRTISALRKLSGISSVFFIEFLNYFLAFQIFLCLVGKCCCSLLVTIASFESVFKQNHTERNRLLFFRLYKQYSRRIYKTIFHFDGCSSCFL